MKKHLLIAVSLLILLTPSFCQITVPSSCNAPDSIKAKLTDDAYKLAIINLFETNHINSQQIVVPQQHVDTVMDALVAVYNARLPYRDTVFKKYNIQTNGITTLNAFFVNIDSAHPWTKQWRQGHTLTGDNRIDSYLNRFQFSVKNVFSSLPQSYIVSFSTTQKLNIKALTDSLNRLSVFHYVVPNGSIIEGYMGVFYTVKDDVKQLIFWRGEGDCFAGCINRWYWHFSVFPDCSVRYDGESRLLRDPPSVLDLQTKLKIAPNPASDVLHIWLAETNIISVQLFDIQGRQVKETTMNGTVFELKMDIHNIPAGLYILKVVTAEGDVYRKVIKRK